MPLCVGRILCTLLANAGFRAAATDIAAVIHDRIVSKRGVAVSHAFVRRFYQASVRIFFELAPVKAGGRGGGFTAKERPYKVTFIAYGNRNAPCSLKLRKDPRIPKKEDHLNAIIGF